jgi:hypothetical protein
VKGAGEHQEVVAREFIHAGVKLAVVNQAARLADDEKSKDNPGIMSTSIERTACYLHVGQVTQVVC